MNRGQASSVCIGWCAWAGASSERGAGYCHYDVDVMGAWSSSVAFLFVVDILVVVALLLIAGRQAKAGGSIRLGDAG